MKQVCFTLLGVNAINFVFNVDAQMRRFWSTALPTDAGAGDIPYTLALDPADAFTNARLFFNFLTLQQTNMISARNLVPYTDFPCYITSQQNTSIINAGQSGQIIINNLQLNL